ncbi:MAG: lipocalin family protein [Wenzhouxiangella sp.]|jgi:apolipoprotein D and lipocalin family protein|nr:lipocalin family protein [Wenzhouxiangella sp.]
MKKGAFTLAMAAQLLSVHAWASEPLELVDEVDLERYQGRWYEIALLPNVFQRRCVSDTTATYGLREDGRIDVLNRCREDDGSWATAEGIARKQDPDGPDAKLEVRFAPRWLGWLPFVWGDYRVIALDDAYQYAMVGSKNRKYLWILARSPDLDEAVVERLKAQATEQGFDVSEMVSSPHTDDA